MEVTRVLTDPTGMRQWSTGVARQGRTIGFVPTMGALHDGHLALVEAAGSHADAVVVSVFVNQLQFDQRVDFDAYPRPIDEDVDHCRHAGVEAVYAPTAAAMYPPGFDTRVVPGTLADRLEGAARPGHFDGVATVVTKLFAAVRPDVAVFGEKDYQQLALVRRLAADLDLGVQIVSVPTVRDADGLALSSRNRLLDGPQRLAARCVPRALAAVTRAIRQGVDSPRAALDHGFAVVAAEPAARLDYLELVDAATFGPARELRPGSVRLVTAVRVGEIRLIDNVDPFDPPPLIEQIDV